MRHLIAVSCVFGFAVTWAGCGGGGGDEGPSLIDQYNEALTLPSASAKAKRLVEVARLQRDSGDVAGAEASVAQAAAAAKNETDPIGQTQAYVTVAQAQAEFGRKDSAEDSLKEARKSAGGVEHVPTKADLLGQIAVVYGTHVEKKSVADALIKNAADAINAMTQADQKSLSLASLAFYYSQLGDEAASEAVLDEALAAAQGLEDQSKQADAIATIAGKVAQMGKADRAKQLYDEAVKAAESISDPATKAHVMADLALKLTETGETAIATELLDKAAVASDEIGDTALRDEAKAKIDSYRASL